MADGIKEFVPHLPRDIKLCLQAGGAHGQYPIAIVANIAKEVVTVEPDAMNWPILVKAISGTPEIKAIRAGLWDKPGRASVRCFRDGKHLTSYIISGDEFDLITIDSLGIKPDLIWLDIEGAEFRALSGGLETLEHCRAVIIEQTGKGLENNVGCEPGQAAQLLLDSGFKQKFRYKFDNLYIRNGA